MAILVGRYTGVSCRPKKDSKSSGSRTLRRLGVKGLRVESLGGFRVFVN